MDLFPKNLSDKSYEDFKLIQVTFFKKNTEAKINFDDNIKSEEDKEEFSNEIKSKIKLLNSIFKKNVEINQDLIKLITLMFENYHNTIDNTPNYNIINQLKNLTKFNNNIKQFNYDKNDTVENNINKYIEYLKGHLIIKTMNTPLNIEEKINMKNLGNIRVIIALNDNRICIGNWQSELFIMNLTDKKIIKNITGHFSGISTACFINNKYILSGSEDSAINLYDPDVDSNNERGENSYKGFIDGHEENV